MRKRGIIFLALYALLSLSALGQGKLNELTRSNMSFKKGYKTESFRDNDKNFRDSSKRFSTDNYYDSNKSFYDSSKRVENSNYHDAQKRAGGFGGTYDSKNQSTLNNKSRFYDENKELFLDNKDRDLSRGYQGKSDFSKRNNMGDSIESMYDDLMDKSMSDINKYHSQSSRQDSREAGIPVSSTIAEKESSILDLLDFSSKKIDNSSVKFSLPRSMKDMGGIGGGSSSSSGGGQSRREVGGASASNSSGGSSGRGGESRASSGSQVQDFSDPNRSYAPVPLADKSQQNNPYQKKTITVDKPVKEGEEKSIFGLPREFNSGKVQITVEVKSKD